VTGFHSVMLKLYILSKVSSLVAITYPDSVNLVRPPNTTIPKTLAALPRSQYPTDFELFSGKKFLPAVLRALPTIWLGDTNGEAVAAVLLVRDGMDIVLLHWMLCRITNFPAIVVERAGTVLDKH
jgi:hypothetical protein